MGDGLLTPVLEATRASPRGEARRVDRFLEEPSPSRALATWLGLRPGDRVPDREAIQNRLCVDVARLDAELQQQLDAVLHHPAFQALEASWRGLHSLCDRVEDEDNVKIRILDATWAELCRDLDRAIEFDQSQLFRKVYSDEFGTAGGEPFGVLLGDYTLRHRPSEDHPTRDVEALRAVSQVAAAAFAPFVTSIEPEFLGLESFRDLERPIDLERLLAQHEHAPWQSLRRTEDARFVGLTLPRVLMRLPYSDDPGRADGFPYRESSGRGHGDGLLWGTPVYAFGAVLVRAFVDTGWLADIRGAKRGEESGGLVTGLPIVDARAEARGVAPTCSTDVVVTDAREKELSDLGFMPLCHCHGTDVAAFHATPSIQEPKERGSTAARDSARLSSMLQYMFCVSRFAHYVKVLGRDKVGSFTSAEECEKFLSDWLVDYSTSSTDASSDLRSKYPLREASVRVREHPGKPGVYLSIIDLRPHFQLDQITSSIRLVTELFSHEV